MRYNSKLCTYAWKEQGSSLYLIVIQWAQVVYAWCIQLKPESGGCIYQANHKCIWYYYYVTLPCTNCARASAKQLKVYAQMMLLYLYIDAYCIWFWVWNVMFILYWTMYSWLRNFDCVFKCIYVLKLQSNKIIMN